MYQFKNIIKLHETDKIKYREYLTHNELLGHLQDSDIVVLLSLEEGQVYSVLEAIYCGCVPLISKYCGIEVPLEYIVENPRDENEIIKKFENIINNIDAHKEKNKKIISLIENANLIHSCDKYLEGFDINE